MNELEDLKIYSKYVDLYSYTYLITEKFPKTEKFSLVTDIKNITYRGLVDIIDAHKEFNRIKRLGYLNNLDSSLKVLKVLVRIAYKKKYINITNYNAWSRKITDVSNLMYGWIKSCQRV